MAVVTATDIDRGNRGSLKMETGYITINGSNDAEVETSLRRIYFICFRGTNAADVAGTVYVNSTSASAVENDPGWFHIVGGTMVGSGVYQYQVIGKG